MNFDAFSLAFWYNTTINPRLIANLLPIINSLWTLLFWWIFGKSGQMVFFTRLSYLKNNCKTDYTFWKMIGTIKNAQSGKKKTLEKETFCSLWEISLMFQILKLKRFLRSLQQTTIENNVTRRNYSKQAISAFATVFSTLFNFENFIYRDFPYLYEDVVKVVCCWFIVCGKGLFPAKESKVV